LAQREQPIQMFLSISGRWVRQNPVLLAKDDPGSAKGR